MPRTTAKHKHRSKSSSSSRRIQV